MTSKLMKEYGSYSYKNVFLAEIAIKFYLNNYINSTDFFKEIQTIETQEEWNKLLSFHQNNFKNKASFFSKIKDAFLDVVRYFKYAVTPTVEFTTADYYFFITNKKFISFTENIRENLEKKGIRTSLLIWETKDVNESIRAISNTPKVAFPQFWKKQYFQFRPYTHLVDRVLGYKAISNAKSVVLAEGCVLSEHIVGEVCKTKHINTSLLQWGFFAKTVTQGGWREMPFTKFLVWGEFYKKSFSKYNTLPIIACGHPTLDHSSNYNKEKVILFAVQKVMGDHIKQNDILNFIDYAIIFAKKLPDFKVIIRSHPDFKIPEDRKQNTLDVQNIIWHDYYNFSLKDSFADAKYCVSISSTVSLESIAFGCYPLFLKANALPLQVHYIFDADSGFEHVFDYDSFESGIEKLEKSDVSAYIKKMKTEFYKTLGDDALEAISNELTK
ncbi:MAG TPA: hypothetical protein PKN96_09800 [Flavobacterium sp.]|uniref:hypothetical protein n=1 Tax=Flavobacterium sp. TaxID=239 RepID=UPI002C3853E3|nr:hypothetical protein [Flavobacterium sp.]HNP33574.1 hypothetical protein [Flavobacterium sp.]